MNTHTIEAPKKLMVPDWINPDGTIDPTKFNGKLYLEAVTKSANMLTPALERFLDNRIRFISMLAEDTITVSVDAISAYKEKTSIYAFLLHRRR